MDNPSFHLEGVVREKDEMQDFEGPLSLILMLLSKNKTKVAGSIVKQAIELNPQSSEMHKKMGDVYARQSEYTDAEIEYNNALSIKPDNKKALSALADVYEINGKNNAAVKTMESLERLDPENLEVTKQYASVLLSANRLESANEKIQKLWKENPEDVHTLNLLGQYYI